MTELIDDIENTNIWAFIRRVDHASTLELIAMERTGIRGRLVKAMAEALCLPVSTFYEMLGLPKATIEKKIAADQQVTGAHGIAALGMAQIFATADNIVANSTSLESRNFDAGRWLGNWVTRPQPALGGKRPADLLDTPTGISAVHRLLGAMESGAYL